MKLNRLLEAAPSVRSLFLEFQTRLIELDDEFEQADPAVIMNNAKTRASFVFIRSTRTKLHQIKTVFLTCYDLDLDPYFKISASKLGKYHAIGPMVLNKTCINFDEAFKYLQHVGIGED